MGIDQAGAAARAQSVGLIKDEISNHYGMLDLLDVFVEADRLVDFTRFFTHSGTKEVRSRETLRPLLILDLFAEGTNTGIKRVANANDPLQLRRTAVRAQNVFLTRGTTQRQRCRRQQAAGLAQRRATHRPPSRRAESVANAGTYPTVAASAIQSASRSACYKALSLILWPIVAQDSFQGSPVRMR